MSRSGRQQSASVVAPFRLFPINPPDSECPRGRYTYYYNFVTFWGPTFILCVHPHNGYTHNVRMAECGDEVRELLHDGCPVACLGDAPFGYVNVFTSHVNVGFFHGAALPDPARLLEGSGRFMRHVKLRPGTAENAAALSKLIDLAYADIKARVENG